MTGSRSMVTRTFPDDAPAAAGIAGDRAARAREIYGERERFVRDLLAGEDRAALYEALAALERNLRQAEVYRRSAACERGHAAYWRERLCTIGYAVPKHALSLRTYLLIHLARWLGDDPE